jgi:hypothetical protein
MTAIITYENDFRLRVEGETVEQIMETAVFYEEHHALCIKTVRFLGM